MPFPEMGYRTGSIFKSLALKTFLLRWHAYLPHISIKEWGNLSLVVQRHQDSYDQAPIGDPGLKNEILALLYPTLNGPGQMF